MKCDVGKAQLILQPFRDFTYVTAHSPTFRRFAYDTAHSLTLPVASFTSQLLSNPSFASPTSQLILQPFRCFTFITAHSPTLSLLHLHHSSFSNPFVASPSSQLILQPFFSLLRHRSFTHVNWRAGHVPQGLNISTIRVFDQIRHTEIPITLHPYDTVEMLKFW